MPENTNPPRAEDQRAFRINPLPVLNISRSHLYALEKKGRIRLIRHDTILRRLSDGVSIGPHGSKVLQRVVSTAFAQSRR